MLVSVERPACNNYQQFSGKRSRSPILEIDSWMQRVQPTQTRLHLVLNSGLEQALTRRPHGGTARWSGKRPPTPGYILS